MIVDSRPLNLISVCAGVGGLDLGVELATGGAARSVVYVEREIFAAAILAARMEDQALAPAPIWSDLRTFDGRPWRGVVHGVIGGIPCQPHSYAGKRLGQNDERDLWPEFRRVVEEVQPEFLFIENVGGFLTSALERVTDDLRRMGFRHACGLFTASEVGAPHKRERLFILGVDHAGSTQRAGGKRGGKSGRLQAQGQVPRGGRTGLAPCAGCGYEFDHDLLGKYGCPNCKGSGLANARCERPQGQRGDGPAAGPVGRGDGALADAREPDVHHTEAGRGDGAGSVVAEPSRVHDLPVFPPGPGARAQWRRILAVRPDLAPAVEPRVRGVAHESAGRLDRLRALGNGVVPLEAAHAFRTLWACLQECD